MNYKKLLPILSCLFVLIQSHSIAQFSQQKHVIANGGTIVKNNAFSSQSVVGQMVSGIFSASAFSGTIGYLDYADSVFAKVNTKNFQLDLQVYPNPNNGTFILSVMPSRVSKVTLSLINMLGQVIDKREEMLNLGPNTFTYSNMPKGVFVIQAIGNDWSVGSCRVVVQ